MRTGFAYQINSWSKFGVNIRTGLLNKQQDPQLTLGNGFADNGLLPFGIYKLYFKIEKNGFRLTLGKDDFPFKKNNQLFWSDHVCPEGIFVKKKFSFESEFISSLGVSAGHLYSEQAADLWIWTPIFKGYKLQVHSLINA